MYPQRYSPKKMDANGYSWLSCNCCPYGYHIDLDFVRYCESIGQQAERTGSIKVRRDRRRQRKSMDVLLGVVLLPPAAPVELEDADLLEGAINDFERTLKDRMRARNLPDVTAVTASSMSADVQSEVVNDTCNTDSSPAALQTIRERMALSLERTKQLEDQVKLIPTLRAQLTSLKEEKRQLLVQIQEEQTARMIPQSGNYKRRDVGVTCSVLTRTVGIGPQFPRTKSTATDTSEESHYTDKWYAEKVRFLGDHKVCAQTQTVPANKKESGVQTPRKSASEGATQTQPPLNHVSIEAKPDTRSVGIGQVTPTTVSVAVGPETASEAHVSPISLASLAFPRSKSFNLGEDRLELKRTRNVGCQYEPICVSKGEVACQCIVKTITRACQYELRALHKAVQSEATALTSRATETEALGPQLVDVGCATIRQETADSGCNTVPYVPPEKPCLKCVSGKEREEGVKKDVSGGSTSSRIPRPQIPTTPVEVRKFRRQDTYTKIPGSPTDKSPGLSVLDLPLKANDESPVEKLKYKLQDISTSSTHNGEESKPRTVQVPSVLSFPEPHTQLFASKQRNKAVPSKEMQAAMKVVNDCLQKNPNKNVKNQLKNATNMIQQEWFKISSLITANPLDVEDYLDAFEDVSSVLLEYIVNMTDASGNTAMHYAVSHGNFDVVSILLDSKVCDINKPNKAGYTCVMLVSLAEVRLESHSHVVRRLFQMADVNVRAKQHGQTALMLAVSHGRLDMVTMLLEAGADINIQDEDGSTALMCAAEHGHVEIVKHFLSHPDCDSSKTDVDGSTALKIAMEAGHRHIGVLLYAHERSLQGLNHKKSKSSSASPKTPSSPLPHKSVFRALSESKASK